MKILYIVPFVPWPLRVRSYNLLPRLAKKHEISLVCISSTPPTEEQREFLERCCRKVVHVAHGRLRAVVQCAAALPTRAPLRMAYCGSRTASNVVREMLDETKPDVIYVERWRPLQYVPEEIEVPVMCDPTDSMTLYNSRLRREGLWWERVVGSLEYRRFSEYEGKLARRVDVSVFCSRLDMECVRNQAPDIRCEIVPNGVDCKKYFFKEETEEEPGTLAFTGNFKYRPNIHAAKYFLEDIYPRIQRSVPEVKVVAVGNGAETELANYRKRAGVKIVDFVPDLRPYVARAAVAVAPLTVGAGVTNKLAEAFAVGTPMVSTPLACGDLPVKDGDHLLIGRNAKEFADNVVTLLRDRVLRTQVAVRARRFVENYDWEIVSRKMDELLEETVARKTGSRLQVSAALA